MKTIIYLLAFMPALASCQQAYEIDKAEVERIITELSSDEMRGRRAFTEDIDKAADLIAREFAEIGLKPLSGEDDYLQKFELYSYAVSEASISVNDRELDPETYLVIAGSEDFNLSEISSLQYISAGDNFGEKFGQLRDAEENTLVVVDTTHAELMARYSRFYSRPRWTSDNEKPGVIFALYSGDEIAAVSVAVAVSENTATLKNVAGMVEGKIPDEYVLFSAHYDHIGIRAGVEGDSIANGANDDASGTTAVIQLARYYKARPQPERSLLFVAFTAEEVGGYGSSYFSEQWDPDKIVAMFNIEMIGKPGSEGPNSAWITGWDKSDFGPLLQQSAEGSIYTFFADPYPDQNLFYRSDNATLARLGVPAHSISTTAIDVDKDYHQVSDEVSTLDLEHLTNTIKAIATGAEGMVDGSLTPTRVDPATVN